MSESAKHALDQGKLGRCKLRNIRATGKPLSLSAGLNEVSRSSARKAAFPTPYPRHGPQSIPHLHAPLLHVACCMLRAVCSADVMKRAPASFRSSSAHSIAYGDADVQIYYAVCEMITVRLDTARIAVHRRASPCPILCSESVTTSVYQQIPPTRHGVISRSVVGRHQTPHMHIAVVLCPACIRP